MEKVLLGLLIILGISVMLGFVIQQVIKYGVLKNLKYRDALFYTFISLALSFFLTKFLAYIVVYIDNTEWLKFIPLFSAFSSMFLLFFIFKIVLKRL